MGLALTSTLAAGTGAKLIPVPFTSVRIQDAFWAPRLEVTRLRTLPHNLDTCERTGRIRNFAQTAGVDRTPFRGHVFHDSDLYKVLEGAAYCLALHPDAKLEARINRIIDLIARSQQADGYVNTWFTMKAPDKRWTGLRHAHELYCAGHMFEAAVAHYKATGKKTFLDVACKFADYIGSVFGPGRRHGIAGHPEIELALIKLWRATGEERYLKLSKFFVEEHGQAKTHKLYGTFCQDHKPIREQDEAVGHCVRAMYFYSAVADLAALTGDKGYIDAMERLWDNVAKKKMYVTGGVGVHGHGEGFARPYFLPNEQAYAETCAAIGNALWNHRLLLLKGEGRFADVFERALYNGLLSGVSLDGTKFFYVNLLASKGRRHRQSWYGCACCPTNVVRFIPAIGGYAYASSAAGDVAYVVHYIAGSGVVPLKGGKVTLVQRTGYPWEGNVQIIVEPEGTNEFAVALRIPGWCESFTLRLNGKPLKGLKPAKGFVTIRRTWSSGEILDLELPMPVRRVEPHPKVKENAGRLAIQRGPVVYCLEGCDHAVSVRQIALARDAKLEAKLEPDLLGGVVVIRGKGTSWGIVETDDGGLKGGVQPVEVTAIPYYAWDNRKPGEMVVWIPTKLSAAGKTRRLSLASIARSSASHRHSADAGTALNDGILPKSSIDHSIPRFTWWDHRGTKEWVAYEFQKPKKLSKAEVYWFDDTGRGGCRVPRSWRLLWHNGKEWKPVEATSPYGVERDKFNVVTFKPVTTKAIRLEVQLQAKWSGGILEWRVSK